VYNSVTNALIGNLLTSSNTYTFQVPSYWPTNTLFYGNVIVTDSVGGTVVDLDRPVLKKVRHIVERDGRWYYVVSGCEHFHLHPSRPTTVLILRGAPAAVLVDRIEEMAEMRVLLALPQSFCGEERSWYRGLTVLDRKVLPVVNPKGFLTSLELRQLGEENPGLTQTVGIGRLESERA
jgi:hypothetical protein